MHNYVDDEMENTHDTVVAKDNAKLSGFEGSKSQNVSSEHYQNKR